MPQQEFRPLDQVGLEQLSVAGQELRPGRLRLAPQLRPKGRVVPEPLGRLIDQGEVRLLGVDLVQYFSRLGEIDLAEVWVR